ncbi:MAG: 50S ribosomal protein L16 [Spirochaetes bacterium GWF1_49_6]|jgi:large subunit ribosomal protein L16|nr:MAG: 50S ribosomal protein L16 [Spirochaetes bacterium GWF1_49_6]
MLFPNKSKYRKQQRGGTIKGNANKGDKVNFGDFGIIALEPKWITERQIEAARVAANRKLTKGAKMWIRVFPDKPYTAKGEGVRMGKGKGQPEGWVAVVKPGRVMFEVGGVDEATAKEAFRLASHKLPILVKFVSRVGI